MAFLSYMACFYAVMAQPPVHTEQHLNMLPTSVYSVHTYSTHQQLVNFGDIQTGTNLERCIMCTLQLDIPQLCSCYCELCMHGMALGFRAWACVLEGVYRGCVQRVCATSGFSCTHNPPA